MINVKFYSKNNKRSMGPVSEQDMVSKLFFKKQTKSINTFF